MKQVKFLMTLAIAAMVGVFAACDNTPNTPAGPGTGGETPDGGTELPFTHTFSTSFGQFTTQSVSGDAVWEIDFSTAKMTGYVDATNYANEDWLISPSISLAGVSTAKFSMTYIARYFQNLSTDITVWVSENYTSGAPGTADWTEITPVEALVSGADWETFSTTEYSLTAYAGKAVTIAVKYLSTDEKAGTIEIQSITISEGEAAAAPVEPASGYLNETFASSFGAFEVVTITGTPWVIDYSTAKATGYANGATTASESYLVSPAVDLSAATQVYIQFEYILCYANRADIQNRLLITDNYTGDPATTTWNDITGTLTEGSDWTTFYKYTWQVTSDYLGKSGVRIAFHYSCTSEGSATWEVKNLIMDDGEPTVGDDTGNGGEETGEWVEYPSESGNVTVYKRGAAVKIVDPAATLSATTATCDLSTYGWENAADVPEVTLEDGTTISFAQEGGNNAPKYYTATNGVRMYALNSMTITGSAAIAQVIVNCDVYNGTNYVGNDMLYATASGTTWKVVNDHTENSGGTQLRVKTIEITYAE